MNYAMIAKLQRAVMFNQKENTENIRKWTLWLRLLWTHPVFGGGREQQGESLDGAEYIWVWL